MSSFVGQLYDFLGKKYAVKFGAECSKVTSWMIAVLVIRSLVYLLKIEQYVPVGLIFAFPYPMQILGKYLPWMKDGFPLLPVRLAESIMGRISPMRLTVLIPAHFLGCILGTTIFSLFVPHPCILQPAVYRDTQGNLIYSALTEVLVVSIYVTLLIAVPELLRVNSLPKTLLSLPTLPLMFFCVPDIGSTFNPAAIYALWYVSSSASSITDDTATTNDFLIPSSNPFPKSHLAAMLTGSVVAGIICIHFFPDDSSWKRSTN